jgi:hypothetical protein
MDRVEEKSPEHLAERGLPRDVSVDEKSRFLLPGRVIEPGQPLFELARVSLVGGDGLLQRCGRGRRHEIDLSVIGDLARIPELAREQPDEIAGACRARMPAVRQLVWRHRAKDADELRLFGLEAFNQMLTTIHCSPPRPASARDTGTSESRHSRPNPAVPHGVTTSGSSTKLAWSGECEW